MVNSHTPMVTLYSSDTTWRNAAPNSVARSSQGSAARRGAAGDEEQKQFICMRSDATGLVKVKRLEQGQGYSRGMFTGEAGVFERKKASTVSIWVLYNGKAD